MKLGIPAGFPLFYVEPRLMLEGGREWQYQKQVTRAMEHMHQAWADILAAFGPVVVVMRRWMPGDWQPGDMPDFYVEPPPQLEGGVLWQQLKRVEGIMRFVCDMLGVDYDECVEELGPYRDDIAYGFYRDIAPNPDYL